ncbi:NUDIX hydrolase [Nonomuraea rhizosphaerae]|uniref:NUDIX hydrolase n=1 Tax=Nonomuraea rhizosphaerae TaxID=2665663 RepID=UPI0027E259A2|nr:NUDIX hydrolase [Nonomuraea rhizosphaerae]
MTEELRVAAYAVCIDDDRVLLARGIEPDGPLWTLPGGGLDHGEDPLDAAVREVAEETGYTVEISSLLGINTLRQYYPRPNGGQADFHGIRIVYAARVVGGTLAHEVGGSTDLAAWVDLDRVPDLARVDLIDIALELERARPPHGRL